MALDPTTLELHVYLTHRDLVLRDAAPCRADPPAVGRLAMHYAGRRSPGYNGETNAGLVARCAGILIYAMDGYGLTFEEVCGVASQEVATLVAGVTPDNRMTEPTRHLKLREAMGLASELGQLVKLAEIAAFTSKVLGEFLPEDYLRHGPAIKLVAERHGQLIQAMHRLAHWNVAESTREALTRVAHEVEGARKARPPSGKGMTDADGAAEGRAVGPLHQRDDGPAHLAPDPRGHPRRPDAPDHARRPRR
jgi:hypothetical protein